MGLSVFAWLGAMSIGVSLGLLGSGGSILTVPVLVYLIGQDEKLAIASSLAIVGTIALAASLPYLKNKQVDWRMVVLFGIPGMAGTYIGAWLATWIPGLVQLTVFAGVMLLASWQMLKPVVLEDSPYKPRDVWKIGLDGLLIGVLTGVVGVGGGFLIVPALVLLGGLTMHRAVATSLLIIALKSFTGFWKYMEVLEIQGLVLEWNIIAIVTGLGVVGSFAGNHIANRVPHAKLKKVFAVFLIIMGIYILVRTLPVVWPF